MRVLGSWVVWLLVQALVCAPALAGGLCLENRPIRFAHYDEGGVLYSAGSGGIDDDIQRELERRSGCRFEISLRPRARIWLDLERGDLDMAGSGVQNPERDHYVWFGHYVVEENRVFLGPSVPDQVRSMRDFQAHPSMKLGGVRSYSYGPFFDQHVAGLMLAERFYPVADAKTLFRMFAAQRFDAFIASQFLSARYFKLLHMRVPKRVEAWDTAAPAPSGLVIGKRSFTEAQARAWQALVHDMLADGTVLRIVNNYLGAAEAQRSVYKTPASGR